MKTRKPTYWIALIILAAGYFACPHHGPLATPCAWSHTHPHEAENTDCDGHDGEESGCDCLCCEDYVGHHTFEITDWIEGLDSRSMNLVLSNPSITIPAVDFPLVAVDQPPNPLIRQGMRVPNLSSLLL